MRWHVALPAGKRPLDGTEHGLHRERLLQDAHEARGTAHDVLVSVRRGEQDPRFRVQGKDAPGGAYDYLAHGQMMGGFALVAYPAQWGVSGVMTFIVNQDGVVYQKDLGPNSAAIARAMKAFNPDSTWKKV